MLFLMVLGFSLIFQCEAYVLLQVRKHDDNHSNVDALIQKTVPSERVDTFARHFQEKDDEHNNFQEIDGQKPEYKPSSRVVRQTAPRQGRGSQEPTIWDVISVVGQQFVKPSGPQFRAKPEGSYYLESGKQSSQPPVYQLHSETVISALNEILSSRTVNRYVENLSRKAAAAYQAVKRDLQPYAAKLQHKLRQYGIDATKE